MTALLRATVIHLTLGSVGTAQGQPTGYVLSGVPLVRQTFNACGPASVTEVLAYYGIRRSLADVSARTRPTPRSSMTAQAIVTFAPEVGLEARLYRGGSVDTVRRAVTNRLPLIVLQSHVTSTQTVPHWRVVGFDDARRQVYLMDPRLGYVLMTYSDFERVWADHQGTFAVMYPPALRVVVRRVIG